MKKNDDAGWKNGLWGVASGPFERRLRRFLLRRMSRHAQEVDDVMQETYIKLGQIPYDRFIENPEAYIKAVAGNAALDFLSKERRFADNIQIGTEALQQIGEHPEHIDPEELMRSQTSRRLPDSWLHELPPLQQATVLLFYLEGCSYAQIAERLCVSIRAVERYLYKARERLKQLAQSQPDQVLEPPVGRKEAP